MVLNNGIMAGYAAPLMIFRVKLRIGAFASLMAIAALFVGCSQNPPPKNSQSALPFEFTNVVFEPSAFVKEPRAETLINFSNLVWFSHATDKIQMGLGTADYESTVFFDRTNRTIRKIIQQTTVGTNHYWLIDPNGDGLPDERKTFGERNPEILFQGEWTPARGLWSSREALVNSNWVSVTFTNGRWRAQ